MVEMFYFNSTLNFGIPPVLEFQLEVYYKVDRLLTGLTTQQRGTTVQWFSNKSSLLHHMNERNYFAQNQTLSNFIKHCISDPFF